MNCVFHPARAGLASSLSTGSLQAAGFLTPSPNEEGTGADPGDPEAGRDHGKHSLLPLDLSRAALQPAHNGSL